MKKNKFSLKTKMDQAKLFATSMVSGAMALPMTIHANGNGFKEYGGTSGDKIVEGVKDFFGTIGTYGGGIITVIAVFALILTVGKEDTEGRNKAGLALLGGIALLSTGAIIKLFFNPT